MSIHAGTQLQETWDAFAVATLIRIGAGALHSVSSLLVFASTRRNEAAVTRANMLDDQ
jgi:hypothetical protein